LICSPQVPLIIVPVQMIYVFLEQETDEFTTLSTIVVPLRRVRRLRSLSIAFGAN